MFDVGATVVVVVGTDVVGAEVVDVVMVGLVVPVTVVTEVVCVVGVVLQEVSRRATITRKLNVAKASFLI